MSSLVSAAPDIEDVLLSFPTAHILLITLNRPAKMNALRSWQHQDLSRLFSWYDAEPLLRCAILTGAGRAFCAGADLGEWNHNAHDASQRNANTNLEPRWSTAGFGGLSNRVGKKPVIAAINGICLGGGMEMAINCDLVVAGTRGVKFRLPEVKRGVIAVAGALPRLMRTLGKQRATEMGLLGRTYSSEQMRDWGLVNVVVDNSDGNQHSVVAEAIRLATEISENSPDSVIASREGLRLGWEPIGPVLGTEILGKGLYGRMERGENMMEGLSSFAEKRKPRWQNSKL